MDFMAGKFAYSGYLIKPLECIEGFAIIVAVGLVVMITARNVSRTKGH